MLGGFLPNNFSLDSITDWLWMGVGLTIGSSVAMMFFQPLENSLSSTGASLGKKVGGL